MIRFSGRPISTRNKLTLEAVQNFSLCMTYAYALVVKSTGRRLTLFSMIAWEELNEMASRLMMGTIQDTVTKVMMK